MVMAKHSAPATTPLLHRPVGEAPLPGGETSTPPGAAEEHDASNVPATTSAASGALQAVAAACATAGVIEISLDVTDLDLNDRGSLQALVSLATALRSRGGRMVLVGLTGPRLLTALHAASLTEVFMLWETLRQYRDPGAGRPLRTAASTTETAATAVPAQSTR
jgi:anti-anti-sigma regulatory factor